MKESGLYDARSTFPGILRFVIKTTNPVIPHSHAPKRVYKLLKTKLAESIEKWPLLSYFELFFCHSFKERNYLPIIHCLFLRCSCTCYLDPPEDFMNQQLDKDSVKTIRETPDENQSFPTLPYNQLSGVSVPVSLSDDQETVLTPEEVAEYLELSTETDCQR